MEELKINAVKDYLTFYFELMIDEGCLDRKNMSDYDIQYMAEQVVNKISLAEKAVLCEA